STCRTATKVYFSHSNHGQPTPTESQKLKEAFPQGDEKQATEIFGEMVRPAVRLGLHAAMGDKVIRLYGLKYHPPSRAPGSTVGK
ncbi:hypothetical protein OAE39_01700, partial [Akkermansiaceae bacterium]|nr:hypothetical protein [Akkermansiaceae bacterium]